MPPAWVDFSWAMVRGKRDNVKIDLCYYYEPASVKKLLQFHACWATRKVVLDGWIIDTLKMTAELPPHRVERLTEIVASVPRSQKRVSVKKWQQVLGELRSVPIAIPGSRGLFSLLHEALRHQEPGARIRLSRGVHDCLDDLRWISNDLAARPTRLRARSCHKRTLNFSEPKTPVDMAWAECGSQQSRPPSPSAANETHVDPDSRSPLASSKDEGPILWRARFEPDVVQDLVFFDNPSGQVTNSDLDLAATVAQHDIEPTITM